MEDSYKREKTKLLTLFRKPPFSPSVYLLTNRVTGHRYIGSSIKPDARLLIHKLDLFYRRHANYRLQRDYDLHGEDSFMHSILWRGVCTRAALYQLEQQLIDRLKPEYNINKQAKPRKRKSHSKLKKRGTSRSRKRS